MATAQKKPLVKKDEEELDDGPLSTISPSDEESKSDDEDFEEVDEELDDEETLDDEEDNVDEDSEDEDEEESEPPPPPIAKKKKSQTKQKLTDAPFSSRDLRGEGENRWATLLNDLESAGTGPFFFLKEGKTRLRIAPYGRTSDGDWFIEVRAMNFGSMKSKFLLMAQVISTSSGELQERWRGKVVPVVITKTILKSITGLLGEKYNLLDPRKGKGITIIKSGQKLATSYSVLPSNKIQPLELGVEWPEEDIFELAKIYIERAADQDKRGETDELEGSAKGGTSGEGEGW